VCYQGNLGQSRSIFYKDKYMGRCQMQGVIRCLSSRRVPEQQLSVKELFT
jgi:hypothetical protein